MHEHTEVHEVADTIADAIETLAAQTVEKLRTLPSSATPLEVNFEVAELEKALGQIRIY